MTGHATDLEFPKCCVYCPYLKELKTSCTHDLRQSLIRELDTTQTCPVYSMEKTNAMRRLLGST